MVNDYELDSDSQSFDGCAGGDFDAVPSGLLAEKLLVFFPSPVDLGLRLVPKTLKVFIHPSCPLSRKPEASITFAG